MGLTLLTLAAFQQQVRDLYAVPDRGDPLFSIWRMAWVRHQLSTDPRHLFDANIFYPLRATLTYSDSMILPALATAPLSWLRVHPVVAYNIALLASFVCPGVAAYVLARGLGTEPLGAWIAAVAFTHRAIPHEPLQPSRAADDDVDADRVAVCASPVD